MELDFKKLRNIHKDEKEGLSTAIKRLLRSEKKANSIKEITTEDGRTIRSTDEKLNAFVNFFQDVYSDNVVDASKQNVFINNFLKKFILAPSKMKKLNKPITISEVKAAITKLNPNSAPGLDGLTSNYYKMLKNVYAPLLQKLFKNSSKGSKLPLSFSQAVIKLLPKVHNSNELKDFRPIRLINTDQKILSHLLASRVKKLLNKVRGKDQSAYLRGRQINSTILITRLLIKKMRKNDAAVCLDFKKAFDSIDRKYIFRLLEALQIPSPILNLIKMMYFENSSYIEMNGYLSRPIKLERGVKQGCPLSALLFILAIEPLLNAIRTSKEILPWCSRKVAAYADDITCFTKLKSCDKLFELIEKFTAATQLTLNKSKTETLTKDPDHKNAKQEVKILGIHYTLFKANSRDKKPMFGREWSKEQRNW